MPFTVQQTNATSRLVKALAALKDAYYECLEQKEGAALIGIPPLGEFPAPGELDHVTRPRLILAHGVVDAFRTWMTTAIDLDGAGGQPNKSPLDAVVEVIR